MMFLCLLARLGDFLPSFFFIIISENMSSIS